MFLGPLFFIGFILLVAYLLIGPNNRNVGSKTLTLENAPLEILGERLARGDIDAREYDEKRRILENG